MPIIANTDDAIKTPLPTDPHDAAEFDELLKSVHQKYISGSPLTTRELVRLAQSALQLIGRDAK